MLVLRESLWRHGTVRTPQINELAKNLHFVQCESGRAAYSCIPESYLHHAYVQEWPVPL